MPNLKDDLKDRLARYRQIRISVIGRQSGKTISLRKQLALPPARAGLQSRFITSVTFSSDP
jgi:hypothetical protein